MRTCRCSAGDFARAAATLEKGLTLSGDRAAFLVKLGEARIELKQFDAAEAALLDAIKTKRDQSMAHYNLALVHEERQDWHAAAKAYEAEIAVSPKLYQPHFNLAKLLSRAGRGADAVDALSRGGGEESRVWHRLSVPGQGAARRRRSRWRPKQSAKQGLASKPDASMTPLGHYVLADVYSRQGREC